MRPPKPSQVPQPTLRSGLGERMPPERIIFLQRLLEPSFCILAPYLHTFLDRAVWQHQLLLCQNLCKSIEKKARADLAPPPICHFSATSLSFQILHFFQIGFLTILVSVFARHISGTVLGYCASLQNILSQFWCLRCDIFKIIAAQANKHTIVQPVHSLTIARYKNFAQMTHQQCSWPVTKQKIMENNWEKFNLWS